MYSASVTSSTARYFGRTEGLSSHVSKKIVTPLVRSLNVVASSLSQLARYAGYGSMRLTEPFKSCVIHRQRFRRGIS
jgi:hypothetical protein